MGNFVLIVKFNSLLYFKPVSLFPTFKPSRRVSCALLPWSEGAVKKVIYAPEILLACIQLATTTDTGGDDFIATGDGDKTLARWKQACDFWLYLRIWLRSLDLYGTFVLVNGGGRLPLCNVNSPLFGLTLPDSVG